MEFLKKLLLSYLNTGVSSDKYDETNRKILIINLFGLVGMSITGSLAIVATLNKNFTLALVLFIASFIYYLSRHIQNVSRNYKLSSAIILYSLYLLMFYLVYDGGVNNTGPLWIFMVAPVSLFIRGLKNGLIDIGIFLLVICTLLFYPNEAFLTTTYDTDFKLRLIFSFLTVTFLSAFYEYSRQQSYQFMLEVSQKFEQLSKIDPLTQLSNRRDAIAKIEYEQRRISRNNSQIGLILCDVDHFKLVNDNYGHEAGDIALIKLAKFFKQHIRQQDTVARWGGEEFLFILPDTNAEQAIIFANKLHQLMHDFSIIYLKSKINITVSMGVHEVNGENGIQDAISIADKYLYQAKEAGRNKVEPPMITAEQQSAFS